MPKKIRKICVVLNNRANYARIKFFLKHIKLKKNVSLKIILGASANLERFGNLNKILKQDGFQVYQKIFSVIEGENNVAMAKSTGMATIELSSIFDKIKPDIVLTVADRYETLATAIAASYLNIFLAHTQGGEVSGSIDESVRHAITKLSHIHFPSTKRSRDYIIKMGENKKYVHLTGCPSIDILKNENLKMTNNLIDKLEKTKTGGKIDLKKEYLVLMQHPVTTEYKMAKSQIIETINAAKKLSDMGKQILWLWPNIDAGSDIYSKEIRKFREKNNNLNISFSKNFSPEEYAILINNCSCIIGNSSSGIRESTFLGVPSVNIGNRQRLRETGKNVLHVNHNMNKIVSAVISQANKKYKRNLCYGNGNAGKKMADILSRCDLNITKKLNYI